MSKNVFADLGFNEDESKDLELKVKLIDGICQIIDQHQYSQKELQIILGQKQPEISYLLHGKISRFSSDKLISFLTKLNGDIEIKIKIPKRRIAIG